MEISFPEILLIVAIALLVMGPKELIKTSQQIGRWVGKFRTQMNNFKVMLNEELLQEEKEKIKEIKDLAEIKDTSSEKNIERKKEGGASDGTSSS